MKTFNNIEYFSGDEVAKQVGRGYRTIVYWYDAKYFAEENNIEFPKGLPPVHREFDERGTRYWTKEDIQELIKFKNNLKSGSLSFYSRKLWGKRGKKIQENMDIAKQQKLEKEKNEANG